MIDLTPLEVRQKKGDFRRGFRGYDEELVNDFLDLVADRMEELVRENMGLKDVVESMETELKEYRQKEQALSGALMTAQRLQEDARAAAEKEGELLVREARLAAAAAREEAARAMAREEETLRQVRGRRGQLVESFRRLLERELAELAVIEEALELQADDQEDEDVGAPAPRARGRGRRAAAEEPGDAAAEAESEGDEQEPEEAPEGRRQADDAEAEQEDWLSSLVEE